jgi:hypothetical protein
MRVLTAFSSRPHLNTQTITRRSIGTMPSRLDSSRSFGKAPNLTAVRECLRSVRCFYLAGITVLPQIAGLRKRVIALGRFLGRSGFLCFSQLLTKRFLGNGELIHVFIRVFGFFNQSYHTHRQALALPWRIPTLIWRV